MQALKVNPGAEPFTKDDVSQYVKSNRLPKTLADPAQLQVDSLEFITAAQASARLDGASTGLKDPERVAFAIISGPLTFTGPQTKPARFERGYLLFDAATGNLLMLGTLQSSDKRHEQPQ